MLKASSSDEISDSCLFTPSGMFSRMIGLGVDILEHVAGFHIWHVVPCIQIERHIQEFYNFFVSFNGDLKFIFFEYFTKCPS